METTESQGTGPTEVQPAETSQTALIEALIARIERLEGQIQQLSERVELIPRQVRQMGSQISDAAESLSSPRVRDLLNSLLLIYDLADQQARIASPDHASSYVNLRDLVCETLEVHGVQIIPCEGTIQPGLHRAVERIPCSPEEDGQIAAVFRAGFRTRNAVLRCAEVIVKRYTAG